MGGPILTETTRPRGQEIGVQMSSSTRNLTGGVALLAVAVVLVLLAGCRPVDASYEPEPAPPATAPEPPALYESLLDTSPQLPPGGVLPLGDIAGGAR